MRKLEAVTKEIVDELGYLQRREMRMRDTNGESFSLVFLYLSSSLVVTARTGYMRYSQSTADDLESTNDRVKTFSILIMVGIIGLGAWQVRPPLSSSHLPHRCTWNANIQLIHLRSFFKRKYLID